MNDSLHIFHNSTECTRIRVHLYWTSSVQYLYFCEKNTCNIYKISHKINDLRPRRIFFQPLYWTILLGHTDLLIRIRSRCTEEDYVGNCTRREWLATRVDNLQVQTFACFTLLRVSAPLKLTLSNCLSISIWNS